MGSEETPKDVQAGELLGEARYRLDELIGKGATATVWRAHDTVLGVDRAIKLLNIRASRSRSLRSRLLAEARAMARLRHPNILKVHDISFDGHRDYVIMELAEQGSLADWADAHGPMPAEMAVSTMVQVLSALSAAHRHGIIHRDVKPQNILRDAEGTCLLADFGIARLAEDQLRSTRTGVAMGSLAFMAPEQRLDARSVTDTADIYAAGTTLYNLLTTGNPVDLFAADEASSRWLGLPPELVTVIRRAVAYQASERFSSAREMGEALAALLSNASEAPVIIPSDLPLLHGDPSDRALRGAPPAVELRARPRVVDQAITLLSDVDDTGLSDASLASNTFVFGVDNGEEDGLSSSYDSLPPLSDELPAPPQVPTEPRVWRMTRILGAALVLLVMAMLGSRLADQGEGSPSPGEQPPAETQSKYIQPPVEATPVLPTPLPVGADEAQPEALAEATALPPPPTTLRSTASPAPEASPPPLEGDASAIAGTWSGNVHSQRATLVLDGRDEALDGRLTLKHPTTGVARTVSVRGSFDEASGRLLLTEEVDPLLDPTAGRYDAMLSSDRSTVTGKYHAISGDRTAAIALRRSDG